MNSPSSFHQTAEQYRQELGVAGLSLASWDSVKEGPTSTSWGLADKEKGLEVTDTSWFQMASLSKTIATAFAMEFLRERDLNLDTPVNKLLKSVESRFLLKGPSSAPTHWPDDVQLIHLMNHTALGMHYVHGHLPGELPNTITLLENGREDGIAVTKEPGSQFHYSGGGYILLQHIIEKLGQKPLEELARSFLDRTGLADFSFVYDPAAHSYALGYRDDGRLVTDQRLLFPAFAAGGEGTTQSLAQFLIHLQKAYQDLDGSGGLSHDTAVRMLDPQPQPGSLAFMGAKMGTGVFIARAGDNYIATHQAANDGFRGVYLACFKGPDAGKGFVLVSNGDDRAMLLNCKVSRMLLQDWHGVKFSEEASFDASKFKAEEVVNAGLKKLVFDGFRKPLPAIPKQKGELDPLAKANQVAHAEVIFCSDQSFAPATNLFSRIEPVFDPDEFCPDGKVMDSWESQRHNPLAYDYVDFSPAAPARFDLIHISTKFHLGNQCEHASLEGYVPSTDHWQEILPKSPLQGHASHWYKLKEVSGPWSILRLKGYPDGGISRIGLFHSEDLGDHAPQLAGATTIKVYDTPIPKPTGHSKPKAIISEDDVEKNWSNSSEGPWCNVGSSKLGACIESCSDEHYGPAHSILEPSPPQGMHDGFESKRSRGEHWEEVVISLRKTSAIERFEIDFSYFVNNCPSQMEILGDVSGSWVPIVPKRSVKAYRGNQVRLHCLPINTKRIMVKVYPDGGFNRIRILSRSV